MSPDEHRLALALPEPQYYHEIANRLAYKHMKYVPNVHIGQRKLLMSEVYFLNANLDKATDRRVIVYAGSAGGMHLGMILKLYPGVRMILVDPNDHYIRITNVRSITHRRFPSLYTDMSSGVDLAEEMANQDKRLFIYKEYMTDDLAATITDALESLGLLDDVLFISDIRTTKKGKQPTDKDIVSNNAMQLRWRMIMNEPPSLLKVRCTWYKKGSDETTQLPNVVLYLQPWAGVRSAETRAVLPKGHVDLIEFDNKEYEERMNIFNMMRGLKPIALPISLTPELISVGFCLSWDCWREATIWQEYISKPESINVMEEELILTAITMTAKVDNITLTANGGGMLFTEISYPLYISLQRMFSRRRENDQPVPDTTIRQDRGYDEKSRQGKGYRGKPANRKPQAKRTTRTQKTGSRQKPRQGEQGKRRKERTTTSKRT